MKPKIFLKKKVLATIDVEEYQCDGVVIDSSIVPVANGPFSARMRGGLSISVVKSAYQKSIRREYFHLANICALLWSEVGVLYPPLMSNLINRLIVIACEDCAANLKFLHWVDRQVTLLREKKKQGSLNEKDLCLVTSLMSKVPKTRISSWLKSVFYDGLNSASVSDDVEAIYPGIVSLKANYDQLNVFEAYRNALLCEYPLLSIRYAMKIHIDFSEKKNNKKGDKNELCSPSLIWNHLLKIKNDEHMQLFHKWYIKEKNENRIYLVLAHVYLIQPDSFQMDEIDESETKLYMNEWKNLIIDGKVKIPNWMIDMHTSEGKKKGMNSIDFACVGSKIENIWMPLYNPDWIKIYDRVKNVSTVSQMLILEKKELLPKKLPPKKLPLVKKQNVKKQSIQQPLINFSEIPICQILTTDQLSMIQKPQVPRGQLITAIYKSYVYLPREDPEWVYKGPFKQNKLPRLILLHKRYQALKILGANVLDLELMKDQNNCYWIRYKNIATVKPEKWKTKTTHDKINNIHVEIIQRESLGFTQLSKLPIAEIEKILFDNDYLFYLTFLDATLFGCGDLGNNNVLVVNYLNGGKPICYLIDYDDSTTKTSFENIYSVYAKNHKKNKILFDARVPNIKPYILERLRLYRQKQSELENCLGFSLSPIIDQMEKVYQNI